MNFVFSLDDIPTGSPTTTLLDLYKPNQILLIKHFVPKTSSRTPPKWYQDYIVECFRTDAAMVQATLSAENPSVTVNPNQAPCGTLNDVQELLQITSTHNNNNTKNFWYASFILQNNPLLAKTFFENNTETPPPPLFPPDVYYTKPVWMFFGRNTTKSAVLWGRPEHTDSVSHDGTWHVQTVGTKTWHVRPLQDKTLWKKELGMVYPKGNPRLTIEVEEGDLFLINTKLWWHQTSISPSSGSSGSITCMSYARDFYLKKPAEEEDDDTPATAMMMNTTPSMTNVEGLYAAKNVKQGGVLFTEKDLPDCELPRSVEDANCEVAMLPNGIMALVAKRDITVGEWLAVPPSSSSSDDDDEDVPRKKKRKQQKASSKKKKSTKKT